MKSGSIDRQAYEMIRKQRYDIHLGKADVR